MAFGISFLLTWLIFVQFIVISPGRRTEDTPPRIIEQPENLFVPRGEPATLNCKAEGRPDPTISWLKDGQPLIIESDDPRRSLLGGNTLFFLQVVGSRRSGQDGGVYQCVATNPLGVVYSNNATLDIAYLREDFRREPQDVAQISGDSGVLECNPPRGFPTPEVTWLKNDVVVVPDDVRIKLVDDGNLLLKELRKDDEGTYKCTATNIAGERTSREAVLTVHAKPSFVNPPQDTITAPGEAAVLVCEVEGDPAPDVVWSREYGDLPAGRSQQLPDNSLRIRNTSPEDAGVYICTSSNIWGESAAQARLRVSAVPDFSMTPSDKTVYVNQVARFRCQAVGSPPPSIHWQKEGTEDNLMFPGLSDGRFSVSQTGELLEIVAVTPEDAGTYICSATGGTGVAEARAELRVLDESLAPPPIIQYGPSNQTLTVGSTATFMCSAAGNPTPSIQWAKEGTTITFSNARYTRLSDNSLAISNVQTDDSGMYTCYASNNSGETSWSASLLVIDSSSNIPTKTAPSTGELPSAPTQPTRINVTRSSILIQWQAPSSIGSRAPAVSGYQVEYFSPEQNSGWVIAASGIQGDNHLVSHLLPASSYMFIVRSINNKGIGPPSPASEVITTADETTTSPPTDACPPDILTVPTVEITANTPLSPTAIKVSWEALQNEDHIDGYQVRYRLSSGASGAKVQTVYGMTSTIITGLEPGEEYTVAVRPLLCDTVGQESSVKATRTLATGSGPLCQGGENQVIQKKLDASDVTIINTEDLGPNAIQVRWEIARHVSAYIEGFHIKYRGLDPDPTEYSVETITGSTQVFVVLKQLLPWKRYSISVRPFSGFYCGDESDEVEARTGPDIPRGPPRNVNAVSNGTTFIVVTWNPPARDQVHGYIKGYHIACQGNSTSQERNRTIQGNTTFVGRVGGLMAGKIYRVQVAAFTSAGMGPTSSAVVVALPPVREIPPNVVDPSGEGDGITMVASEPWFYGTIIGVIGVIVLLLAALAWRRRKMKHAANLTKNPLGLDGATHMTTLTSQYEGQPANGHPSWPPDQTWRSNNSSDCQSSHHGNTSAAVTTFAPPPNGSLRSMLGKNQYLQPHHSGAGPAYWLLEAYESNPKDQQQNCQIEKGDLSNNQNDQYHRNNVPVYAVVDNESEDDDESPSCPHMAHTLPLQQCNHLLPEHCQSLPQHITEPYASTTLVLPPNVREYMARRQNCSDTSSGSASGSIGYPNTSCGQQKSRKKAGKRSRQGDMEGGGPPLPPHRDTSHLCADCQCGISDSGTSSQGSRRKAKSRTGAGSKYPACNWTEFLPPPPEEPPMLGDHIQHPAMMPNQDSMGKIKHPCNGHPNFSPQGLGGHDHHIPAPPLRQHPSLPLTAAAPAHQHGNPHLQSNGLPHTLPVSVSRGDDPGMMGHPAMGKQVTTLPQRTMNGQYPMGVVPSLAPHQVFADPRHERLGRELLEFNDDLMSQSEVMSDNEEVTPMLPRIGANTGLPDQSKLIPDDLETDVETSSNCTGSMLASWASMNGSSTGGSNRNSGTSCSSDGSFYADTDFASAVTAAAQNAGIKVVGSPPTDLKGQQGMPQPLLPQQRGPVDPYHQQQRILPAPPPHHSNDHQQDSLNKNKRSRDTGCLPSRPRDNLFLRDTNDLGLTVTANPMAFAHEEEEVFNS